MGFYSLPGKREFIEMAAAPALISSFGTGLVRPQQRTIDSRTGPESISTFAPLTHQGGSAQDGIGERKAAPARRELYSQDEAAPPVFFIESGVVKLVRLMPDGQELITGLRSSGCLLDGAASVLGWRSTSKAVTVTPCILRCLPRADFVRALNANADLLKEINELICRELFAGQEQQVAFRCGDAQSRLALLIRELSPGGAIESLDQLPLKRMEIAQLLAITPEHLSRLAKQVLR
jgi:CRP/FNR family transcriptional regulator